MSGLCTSFMAKIIKKKTFKNIICSSYKLIYVIEARASENKI